MLKKYAILMLLSAKLITASPAITRLPVDHERRQQWYPWSTPLCTTCFRSDWTQGPECSTDPYLTSTISRIQNPPAEATATYTPSQWCSDYLRETQWSRKYTTTSLISTYTSWTIEHLYVTVIDYDHPTSTMYCPIPSSSMECGWDSNTIAPWDQGQDWSVEKYWHPTDCQQRCLEKSACKAYRLQDGESGCEIFNVGLGKGASNVINPTPHGSQWWDRNCQKHIPDGCKTTPAITFTPIPTTHLGTPPNTLTPTTESSATPASEVSSPAKVQKRDAPFPDYFKDLSYPWSSLYVTPACSCIISSNLPPTLKTTTTTVTSWTSHITVKSTYDDWFTVTETPRETTIYSSIN